MANVTQTPHQRNQRIRAKIMKIASDLVFQSIESMEDFTDLSMRELELEIESKIYDTFKPFSVDKHVVEDVSIKREFELIWINVTLDGKLYQVDFHERLLLKCQSQLECGPDSKS